MKSIVIRVVLLSALILSGWANPGSATVWTSATGEVEFGITTDAGQDPWVMFSGYNGGWWASISRWMGQSFKIGNQDRSLQSVSFRISRANGASGDFRVVLYDFDETTHTQGTELASVTVNVSTVPIGLTSAVIRTYDMSAFALTLLADQSYLVAVAPMENFVGNMYLQAEVESYADGAPHWLDEPPIAIVETSWSKIKSLYD